MTTESAAKRTTQKLQRAIVDALEDVKAQDIRIFDTEHLSALFERVIIASGTSNRQTKALASSVLDGMREAGFPKPRVEGEANGEWIIVDCGRAVVHIMQPHVRQYYHLEELWGEKPVRLKAFGEHAPEPARKPAARTGAAAPKTPTTAKPSAAKPAGKSAAAVPARVPVSPRPASAVRKTPTARPASAKSSAARRPAAAAGRPAAGASSRPARGPAAPRRSGGR